MNWQLALSGLLIGALVGTTGPRPATRARNHARGELDLPHASESAITVLALGLVALVAFARQARATPAVAG
jgi:hypothetical protein